MKSDPEGNNTFEELMLIIFQKLKNIHEYRQRNYSYQGRTKRNAQLHITKQNCVSVQERKIFKAHKQKR